MGLLDASQNDTDVAIQTLIASPAPPPPPIAPKSSIWSAVPRGVGAAAAEALAGLGELAKGYGQVMGASGAANAGGMFALPTPTERTDQERAARENEQGIRTRNPVSDSFRNVANEYRPDPLTASKAEQVVFGLTKGVTKAVGYTLAGGPVAGAAAFGADEGATATDDLQRQGVDDLTAMGVGAFTGLATGATALLPVAGKGLASTLGIAAVGGPAAFIAQQAATRRILEDANYGRIAEQYDPLDPVGLTLATLIPAAFGGLHLARMRGADGNFAPEAARAAPSPPDEVATPGKTLIRAEETSGLTSAPTGIAPEAMDAAMVHNLTLNADAAPAKERAELQRAWDRVHGHPIGAPDDPLVRLTPEDVDAVLVERGPATLGAGGVTVRAGGFGLVKFIWKHGPESGRVPEEQIRRDDLTAFPNIIREFEPTFTQVKGTDQMTWVVEQPDGRRVVYGTTRFAQDGDHHLVTVHVDRSGAVPPSAQKKLPLQRFGREALQASNAGTPGESFDSASPGRSQGQVASVPPELAKIEEELSAIRQRAMTLEQQSPEVAAELQRVRAEATDGTDAELGASETHLVQAAAECFLSLGT